MHFDLIIIGGGMVGASLACALATHDLKIALVDAAPLTQNEDPRLIALNYSSVCLLKNIQAWPFIEKFATPITSVHVSEKGRFGKVTLSAAELNVTTLGYVVPAKHLNTGLMQHLATQETHLTIFRPATLEQLTQTENKVTVMLKTEHEHLTLTASCVIGADGTQSSVRELLSIPTETTDYHQSAIVTVSELNRHHQHRAYERFNGKGAIAMLPLTGNTCATIWTDAHETIDALMQQDDATFLKNLQIQFGYRLGKLLRVQKRHRYPLKMILATQLAKHRTLLIGNAAHTLSPIAAQGLNLAFTEIAMLTEVLTTQLPEGLTPQWETYLAWQKHCQHNSSQLSHRLMHVFGETSFLLKTLRPLGMLGLDLLNPLKKHFMQKTLARSDELPKLLMDTND